MTFIKEAGVNGSCLIFLPPAEIHYAIARTMLFNDAVKVLGVPLSSHETHLPLAFPTTIDIRMI